MTEDEPVVVEYCANCECENVFRWDVKEDGYVAFCPHCGALLMLCDECTHAEDNPGMRCCEKRCRKFKRDYMRRMRKWKVFEIRKPV